MWNPYICVAHPARSAGRHRPVSGCPHRDARRGSGTWAGQPNARTEPVSVPLAGRISQTTERSPAAQAPWFG